MWFRSLWLLLSFSRMPGVNQAELEAIATDIRHVLNVKDFASLAGLEATVVDLICQG